MRVLRMSLMFVLVVTVGMGAAVGARMLTAREPAAAPKAAQQAPTVPFVVTVPGGKQLKLAKTVRPKKGPFTIRVPAQAEVLPDLAPGASATAMLGVSLRGEPGEMSALFVVSKISDGGLDPVASLRGKRPDTDPKVRSLRRTQVAGLAAATTDRVLNGKQRIRQFRFVHDGVMYGVAIAYDKGDRVALDTGLAVLASWKWTAA